MLTMPAAAGHGTVATAAAAAAGGQIDVGKPGCAVHTPSYNVVQGSIKHKVSALVLILVFVPKNQVVRP